MFFSGFSGKRKGRDTRIAGKESAGSRRQPDAAGRHEKE